VVRDRAVTAEAAEEQPALEVEGGLSFVAERADGGDARVGGRHVAQADDHVDDRLGGQAGDGGGADVLDGDGGVADRARDALALGLERRRPRRVVLSDDDARHRGHPLRA
jgi:hypothetical protein